MPHCCLVALLTFGIKRSPEYQAQQLVPTNVKELVLLLLCSRISFGTQVLTKGLVLQTSCQLTEFIHKAR